MARDVVRAAVVDGVGQIVFYRSRCHEDDVDEQTSSQGNWSEEDANDS